MQQQVPLKIALALLPAAVFTQNWGWMTNNKLLGAAFFVLWAAMVWYVWGLQDKNAVVFKLLRATEIGFFLLPISAIVLTFIIGATSMSSSQNEFEQAGAAIGTAIGGTFAVGLGFVIGLFGGVIMHLFSSRYEKKIDKSVKETTGNNFLAKHKVGTIVLAMAILAVIAASTGRTAPAAKTDVLSATGTPNTGVSAPTPSPSVQPTATPTPSEPSPVAVVKTSVTKDIINQPEANVTFKNISSKTVDGLKVRILSFNNFGEPVKNTLSSDLEFNGISQETIEPGGSKEFTWSLTWFDSATKITAEAYQVHFTDGSLWGEGAN